MLYIITRKLRITTEGLWEPPPLKSFLLTWEFRTKPSPASGPCSREGGIWGREGFWLENRSSVSCPPCVGSPVHPVWHKKKKTSKATVPGKPHGSDRQGGHLCHPRNIIKVKIKHFEQLLSLLGNWGQSNSLVTPCLTSGDSILKNLSPQCMWKGRIFSAHCSSVLSSAVGDFTNCRVLGMSSGTGHRALDNPVQEQAQSGAQAKNLLYTTQHGRTDAPIISFEL